MATFPGPRTNPTVKPSPAMNQRNLRRFELRLGPVQLAILVGIVLGSLTGAYFLGTWTGQQAGFAMASEKTLTSAPRQEIGLQMLEQGAGSGTEPVADIYAKLSDAGSKAQAATGTKHEIPKLGIIEHTEVDRAVESADSADSETAAETTEELDVPTPKSSAVAADFNQLKENGTARVLGEDTKPDRNYADSKADDHKTLGALLQDQESKTKKTDLGTHIADTSTGSAPIITATKEGVVSVTKGDASIASAVSIATPKATATVHVALQAETPKVTPSKPAPTPVPAIQADKPLPKGWFAQVAAPKNAAEAESLSKALKASGFPVSVEKAEVRGEHYFRLLVGPEENKPQAERLVEQLKREKSVKGDPFLRLVK